MENKIQTVTTISRPCEWLRCYGINGKEIECIVIYKDGEILLRTRSGWLESVNEDFSHKYLGDLLDITFDGSLKRANKLNLNRKDNFYMKVKKYESIHNGLTLFIHADNLFKHYEELPKKYLGDKATTEEGKNSYLYGYKVELKYPSTIYESYFKHYNKGDKLEKEDIGKPMSHPYLKDDNGKLIFDSNGNAIEDESKFYIHRIRKTLELKINLYNGLYITSGK